MFNLLRGGLIYCTNFIRIFTFCCFLKKIELLTLLLSAVSYLFINFGGACENACTVFFISNYLLYRTIYSWLFQNGLIDHLTPKASRFISKFMILYSEVWIQGFKTSNPFFKAYTFYQLQHFFSLFCLSWYSHSKHISLLGFKILSFNIWRQ